MPRAGLTTSIVVHEAADLADEIGYDDLTLTALASRLNVAVPSLYKHVENLDDLRRGVAIMAIDELGSAMRAALRDTDAVSGRSNLARLAAAYRRYALGHPGRYAATVRAAPAGDREFEAASDATVEAVFDVLRSMGLRGDDLVHAARGLRAMLHGFATLEAGGGFGLPQHVERSFEWSVETFTKGIQEQVAHA